MICTCIDMVLHISKVFLTWKLNPNSNC
ncbi:hypothetical protein NC653_015054 [Populus alba x Populus x berolinensis]|uniref:Uncharacterized protein n=1 Tax=Populus alba x Populus x berolinensis TaxID=444605 RepID=A0AAD6QZM7_9ROSI|nr:hypothetical protein NC653_015054 [Populus alba x Populus x berolinensis]